MKNSHFWKLKIKVKEIEFAIFFMLLNERSEHLLHVRGLIFEIHKSVFRAFETLLNLNLCAIEIVVVSECTANLS